MPNFPPPPNHEFGWVWRTHGTYAIVKNTKGKSYILLPSGMESGVYAFHGLRNGTPVTFVPIDDTRGSKACGVVVGFKRG